MTYRPPHHGGTQANSPLAQRASELGPVRPTAPARVDAASSQLGTLLRGYALQGLEPRGSDRPGDEGLRIRHKLSLLRGLLMLPDPLVEPALHPYAPEGHACADVEAALGLALGESLRLLEDLADLGLLSRRLLNHVNLCPSCGICQLNFRETCPSCNTIELSIERLVHHFACAHVGPESEFARGIDLVCPKCERVLNQLGQDFDRPSETFLCRPHEHVFDEPLLEGQCLSCEIRFPAHEARIQPIYSYRATPLSSRAVELNRLTGLDVAEMLQDAGLGVATRTFFLVELERELLRLAQQPARFSLATIHFERGGERFPIFRRLSADALRSLTRTVVGGLRSLDLVCRWDSTRLALMILGTDGAQAAAVRVRIVRRIEELVLLADDRKPLEIHWQTLTISKPETDRSAVQRFLDGGAEG